MGGLGRSLLALAQVADSDSDGDVGRSLLALAQVADSDSDDNDDSGKARGLRPGARVQIELEQDIVAAMQQDHGGWNPKMAKVS